ncbi:MAG: hypothetical protein ACI9QL_002113 [Candidatus Omnitrophota bacterium]|jgi:hypothetical protein
MSLTQQLIRFKFIGTSRAAANRIIEQEAARTIALVEAAGPEKAALPTRVKAMIGVDEDMRDWSMYQILEHNIIANGAMTARIEHLVNDTEMPGNFDPKKDVMPSEAPGPEQLDRFKKSVNIHLKRIARHENLRATKKAPHPIFGPFNAHMWHGMCGFHLMLHRRQLEAIRDAQTN